MLNLSCAAVWRMSLRLLPRARAPQDLRERKLCCRRARLASVIRCGRRAVPRRRGRGVAARALLVSPVLPVAPLALALPVVAGLVAALVAVPRAVVALPRALGLGVLALGPLAACQHKCQTRYANSDGHASGAIGALAALAAASSLSSRLLSLQCNMIARADATGADMSAQSGARACSLRSLSCWANAASACALRSLSTVAMASPRLNSGSLALVRSLQLRLAISSYQTPR